MPVGHLSKFMPEGVLDTPNGCTNSSSEHLTSIQDMLIRTIKEHLS
jgi:hypothetical protein